MSSRDLYDTCTYLGYHYLMIRTTFKKSSKITIFAYFSFGNGTMQIQAKIMGFGTCNTSSNDTYMGLYFLQTSKMGP